MTKPAQADSRAGFVVSEGFGRPSGAADLLQKGRGGAFVLELNRDGPGAPGGDELRLGEVLDAVVAALDVDVGVGKLDGLERHLVLEDDHEGDGLERGEYGGAVGLGVDRTVVALAEHLDGGVAVDGHDETAAEAEAETQQQLNCYADVCEQDLAIPVVKGRKTDKEKFAGAEATYTIEAMMQDGKALQSGTSHFLGQKIDKSFGVTFLNKDNKPEYVWATSWGVSTRLIGALIMTHSDDNGLVLPPKLAPIQVVMVPIYKGEDQLTEIRARFGAIAEQLKAKGISVKIDDRDNVRSGFKFAEYELKGVPVRLAMGPRDMENGTIELVRRDTLEKETVPQEGLVERIEGLMSEIQQNIFSMALAYRESMITRVDTWEEFKEVLDKKGGFVLAHWDGTVETEVAIKDATKATIRCIPFDAPDEEGTCVFSGKPSHRRVLFARSY